MAGMAGMAGTGRERVGIRTASVSASRLYRRIPLRMDSWTPAALLPGVWVAALAALLALVLRRGFDPVPRRCWAVWSGVLLVLFGPALFGGRVLLPLGYLTQFPPFRGIWPGEAPGNLLQSDLVLQIAPWLVRVRAAYAAGEWPL